MEVTGKDLDFGVQAQSPETGQALDTGSKTCGTGQAGEWGLQRGGGWEEWGIS